MKLVLEEKIAHGGHPVMVDDGQHSIRTDPAGNIKADTYEKSTEKIDGAIATHYGA